MPSLPLFAQMLTNYPTGSPDAVMYGHEAVDPRDYFTLATKVDLWVAP